MNLLVAQTGVAGTLVKPLAAVATIILGQAPPSDTYHSHAVGLPFLQGKAEFGSLYPSASKWCSAPLKIAPPRATLVSVRAPVGDSNLADQEYCIGRGLAAVVAGPSLDSLYLYYWLSSQRQHLASLGTGSTFQSINASVLRKLPVPVPELAMQRSIARALSAIQQAVDKGERSASARQTFGDLLADHLFRSATTQGEQVRIGEVVTVVSGQVDPRLEPYASLPHIAPNNIEPHTGRLLPVRTARELNLISGKYEFQRGDVLYSKIRPYLNKAVIAPYWGTCSADMYVLRGDPSRLTQEFLRRALLLPNFVEQAKSHQNRTGIPKINRQQLATVEMFVPSLREQRQIMRILNALNRSLDTSLASLTLLRSVFAAAVTNLMAASE